MALNRAETSDEVFLSDLLASSFILSLGFLVNSWGDSEWGDRAVTLNRPGDDRSPSMVRIRIVDYCKETYVEYADLNFQWLNQLSHRFKST